MCDLVQPHLATFSATAACSLLQLLSMEGEYPPSPKWMEQALAGLEPQLKTLEARPALQLLQSLKEFHTHPPAEFMVNFQARLSHLTKKLDAMGIATMVQGLVACGVNPSVEVQRGIARHIKKGLARPSQGMGGTPVWILLGSLLAAASMDQERSGTSSGTSVSDPGESRSVQITAAGAASSSAGTGSVICRELLDELLLQVASQLSSGAVSSSRMCRQVLPSLVAAFVPGGCWAPPGLSYVPSAGFCNALCCAMLELQGLQLAGGQGADPGGNGDGGNEGVELSGLLWLGMLVRFGDMAGFRPPEAWVQAANQAVLASWGTCEVHSSSSSKAVGDAEGHRDALQASAAAQTAATAAAWQAAPVSQFAAWLSAVGRLQHTPGYLPGWPQLALQRLQEAVGEMNGHELSVGLLGVAHQQQLAELAAAGVLLPSSSSSSSSSAVGGSSSGGVMLEALSAAKPQLLAAAEAASLRHIHSMDADDLATLAHALQQMNHTPSPAWVDAWSAAVAAQLPGCSPAAGVLQLAALAGFSARPSAELLQGLISSCQAGLGQMQLRDLLAFAKALLLLRFRPAAQLLQDIVRAGQAAAARAGGSSSSSSEQQVAAQMLFELQQLAVMLAG
jgi:hypothetical protein